MGYWIEDKQLRYNYCTVPSVTARFTGVPYKSRVRSYSNVTSDRDWKANNNICLSFIGMSKDEQSQSVSYVCTIQYLAKRISIGGVRMTPPPACVISEVRLFYSAICSSALVVVLSMKEKSTG
eukprot:scaffold73723_cov67-Attheya_sp.AAC.5